MNMIIPLSGFKLSRLIRDYSLATIIIVLHESAADGKLTRVTNDVESLSEIRQSQDWSGLKTRFDRVESRLLLLSPLEIKL